MASEAVTSVQIWNAVTNTQIGPAIIASDGETWSFSGNLGEGTYQLYAKLTAPGGLMGQTTSEPTIVVDKTPPVPVMLDAIFNSTTNITVLSGTSEANSSVSVYDGTKLIGTVTSAANGAWSLQTNVTGNTIHSFTEQSTDVAGNAGPSAGVTLYSPAANKTLQGGPGNDVLIGGPNDTLSGGGGSNTFVYNPNFGKDTIKDFDLNRDVLAFAQTQTLFPGGVTQVLAQAHDSKAGAVIVVDANDAVTLTGVTVAQLQSHVSDIHFF
jgi:Bacterial Ig domain